MSAQLFKEINELRRALADTNMQAQVLSDQLQLARDAIAKLEGERRELRKEVSGFGEKLETLYAMRTAIFEEARKNGMTRDPLDPTKVKMPQVLKSMGYGKEAKP